MEIEHLRITGGIGKSGQADGVFEVEMKMGDVVSIVGPTGSGKTTLIDDIALFAFENTPSRRKVFINGKRLPPEAAGDPARNPVAFITQHTNFLSDLPVAEFLKIHASVRSNADVPSAVEETVNFANQLTGEPLDPHSGMTELSGGQTRALLIADAVVIGNSPIILLDEIENAGIDRSRALELLKNYKKIFVFVTHDPGIALMSDFRIVMKNGAMVKLVCSDGAERAVAEEIRRLDESVLYLRKLIRDGEKVEAGVMDCFPGARRCGGRS
jgi:ABC-type lipoprotein export system ATPase subunit